MSDNRERVEFDIGDIVVEMEYIIPPDREPWIGVVVYKEKDCFELFSYLGQFEFIGFKQELERIFLRQS